MEKRELVLEISPGKISNLCDIKHFSAQHLFDAVTASVRLRNVHAKINCYKLQCYLRPKQNRCYKSC